MQKILSAIVLALGILLAASMTTLYITTVGAIMGILSILGVKRLQRYTLDIWLGFDKFANAMIGGSHEETVSSRLGKSVHYNKQTVLGFKFIDRAVAKMLDYVDEDHCRKSIQWD